jgi:glycosyltransferase involved in cell wall biosynthesis
MAAPQLSVVVATRNRAAKLHRCLEAITAQRGAAEAEVLVVDDGSTDDTAAVLAAFPRVHAIRRDHGGRGAARNPAVERARAELVLFIDDDVVATEGLLRRHLDHHRRHPEPHEALVGLVTWAPELHVTAHMRWLEDGGPLFAFNAIEDPEDVDWRHFCTANSSVKRAFLPSERPFDEALERCEDVELAFRLDRRGMRLRYDREARGDHLRVDTPQTTRARMRAVGRAMRLVQEKHPELREPAPPFRRLSPVKATVARPAGPLLRRLGAPSLEERLFSYDAALAYARGYANGRKPRP